MTSPFDRIPDLAAWLAASSLDELELTGPGGHVHLRRATPAPSADPSPKGRADSCASTSRVGTARPGDPTPVRSSAWTRPSPPGRESAPSHVVASPGVGHLLLAHPLRDEPLAPVDAEVAAGETIALLRVGALLLPVVSPRAGTVAEVVAREGALVGYGDPIFELWPEA